MDKATWIEVLLAFASAALMAVTVLTALAAIGGWVWFNRIAKDKAAETARTEMEKFLVESNIREMLEKAVAKEAGVLYSDMDKSPGHDLDDLTASERKEKND